jgi:hypothetical protein
MQFRIKKLFRLISLSIVVLILCFNLTVNAQSVPQIENSLSQCSVSPTEQIKVTNKEKQESIEIRPISLSQLSVAKENISSGEFREISLGERIKVTINGLSRAIKKDTQFDPNQLVLQLNGYTLKNIRGTYLDPDQLIFQIAHQEAYNNEWNAILEAVWNEKRNVLVTVGCPDGQRIQFKDSKDLRSNTITILLWHSARKYIVLLPIILLVIVVFTKQFHDALRGSGITSNRVFSLGRFQLAWWSYLILFSFLGLYAVTGSYQNIITSQSMVLLGISTFTTVGGSIIDATGENKQTDLEKENYLKELDSKYKFWQNFNVNKRVKKFDSKIRNIDSHLKQLENQSNLENEKEQLKLERDNEKKIWKWRKERGILDLKAKMNCIEQQSENFFIDILTNPSGEINLHRFQIFIWTLVLGGIFIYQVLTSFKTPEFDANLLTLQGISSGTFLALKSQEKSLNGATEESEQEESEQEEISKPNMDSSIKNDIAQTTSDP